MKPVTAILLGAGSRGMIYAQYAKEHPTEMIIVGVAEPDKERREIISSEHSINQENVCCSWEELLKKPKIADVCLICTLDQMHTESTLCALQLGYHVLLEKPMAITEQECNAIVKCAKDSKKVLSICHVLRYTPFYSKIKAIVDEGVLGEIVSVQQTEAVGYWHQAHSFVRGNWAVHEKSSPMILQKCCHDMDILNWIINKRCLKISSFGSLSQFRPDKAPKGSTYRCLNGCKITEQCPYYAPRFYLNHPKAVEDGFVSAITNDTREEGILEALKEGPYGRCVYHCDNNVVDHQTVIMEYEDYVTATLVMTAFTKDCNRTIRIMGTKGELIGDMNENQIQIKDFLEDEKKNIYVELPEIGQGYHHSGGDYLLMQDFIQAVSKNSKAQNRTSAEQSLQAHVMCFAAEKSRLTNLTVCL